MRTGIGAALPRVDGRLKVTGEARYAAEHPADGLLYGVVVSSSIAKGRIVSIDIAAARALPGVVDVITHENRPHVAIRSRSHADENAPSGSPLRPLYDAKIHFSGQPVALVVAETFEVARYAATLIAVEYRAAKHNTDLRNALDERFAPSETRSESKKSRGDAPALPARPLARLGGQHAHREDLGDVGHGGVAGRALPVAEQPQDVPRLAR